MVSRSLRQLATCVVLLPVVAFAARARTKSKSTEKPAFTSPCECVGTHGEERWAAKTDKTTPPLSKWEIAVVTPADMHGWPGPGEIIRNKSQVRLGPEQKWYAVTGKVEKVKLETDGDIHIVLGNADAREGKVVVELPVGPTWCEMRKTVFSWTNVTFPANVGSCSLVSHPLITVTGKAFYDTDHAGTDKTKNARSDDSVGAWEIHPVMKLLVSDAVTAAPAPEQPQATPQTTAISSATPSTNTVSQEFVTITRDVPITIPPYGTGALTTGMKLPIVAHGNATVRVQYMGANYDVPVTSTDYQEHR